MCIDIQRATSTKGVLVYYFQFTIGYYIRKIICGQKPNAHCEENEKGSYRLEENIYKTLAGCKIAHKNI
jgi:hypothetical protein